MSKTKKITIAEQEEQRQRRLRVSNKSIEKMRVVNTPVVIIGRLMRLIAQYPQPQELIDGKNLLNLELVNARRFVTLVNQNIDSSMQKLQADLSNQLVEGSTVETAEANAKTMMATTELITGISQVMLQLNEVINDHLLAILVSIEAAMAPAVAWLDHHFPDQLAQANNPLAKHPLDQEQAA